MRREEGSRQEKDETWVDPPHVAAAKDRLSKFDDLYELLGVSPDADRDTIAVAYNERGGELAASPDFHSSPELRQRLDRLKHASKVLLDETQRKEYDAHRRSVKEALHRLEVDPAWVHGKERMGKMGRKFLSKAMWAFGVFALMMSVYVAVAVELSRKQERMQIAAQDAQKKRAVKNKTHAASQTKKELGGSRNS